LFSETLGSEALGALVREGALARLPGLEYKAVFAYEGPREGIVQYYVAVSNRDADPDADDRELLLHMANQGGAGFRVNADVLAFQLGKQLRAFVNDPAASPLRAYVFIERSHSFATPDGTPRGFLCLNLRTGPFTPVIGQALVDEGTSTGVDIGPLAAWGDNPKAVIVVLKHGTVGDAPAILVDQFICANWLLDFPKAPPPADR
jgi:hypothetical protein